jgi:hypothetical protein
LETLRTSNSGSPDNASAGLRPAATGCPATSIRHPPQGTVSPGRPSFPQSAVRLRFPFGDTIGDSDGFARSRSSLRYMITGAVLAIAVIVDSLARKSRVSHGRA